MNSDSLPAHLQAWKFLRRNQKYRSIWECRQQKHKVISWDLGIPVYHQTQDDLSATEWGLFAYEPPDINATHANPFWIVGSILEAEPVENNDTPLLPMLKISGAAVSGLQLIDGALILTIRKGQLLQQLRLPVSPVRGQNWNIKLRLPFDLGLPVLASHARDLWNMVRGEQQKKADAEIYRTCGDIFSLLTV